MLPWAKLKLFTNGNTSTHPGLEFHPPPPPPQIAAFLFLPDVKFAMPPLVLFIISIVNRDFSQNVKKRKDLGTRWNVLLIKNVQGK
jgi:hypothetical protein